MSETLSLSAVDQCRGELAENLLMFHPELLTAVISDERRMEIVRSIDSLIVAHVLQAIEAMNRGKP